MAGCKSAPKRDPTRICNKPLISAPLFCKLGSRSAPIGTPPSCRLIIIISSIYTESAVGSRSDADPHCLLKWEPGATLPMHKHPEIVVDDDAMVAAGTAAMSKISVIQ
jgi:hypothetical protein